MPTIPPNSETRWFYNYYTKQCLSSQRNFGKKPLIRNCLDDDYFQWIVYPSPKGYFHSKYNLDWCLNLYDVENGKIKVQECDNATAIFEYTDEGLIKSPLSPDTCLGKGDRNNDPTNANGGYLNPCTKSNDQIWTSWDRNPSNLFNAKTQTVWIYNPKLKKCLHSGSILKNRPQIKNCDNSDFSKWKIPVSGEGFFKSLHSNWCLHVEDVNLGTIIMSKTCTPNSIILDINSTYNKGSIISSLNNEKCLGRLPTNNNNELRLNLNQCNENNNDQHWEVRIEKP